MFNCFKKLFASNKLSSGQKKRIKKYIFYHHSKFHVQPLFSKSYCTLVSLGDEEAQLPKKVAHIPVLCHEVIEALGVKKNGVYLDMTLGSGGHTRMMLEKYPTVKVYGLDRDPHVKPFAEDLKNSFPSQFHPITGKFSDLPQLLHERGIGKNYFSGILMDLGPSSMQFDTPERGFMLSKDGPLDMRMDGRSATDTLSASQILAHIDEYSLYTVLKYYGQEKRARAISRAIIESRLLFIQLNTTKELAELVMSVTGISRESTDKLQRFSHPATKTFQALRILVNDELNQLDYGIRAAHYFLQPEGIIAAISFHSLEDTILKRHMTGTDLDSTPQSIGKGIWKSAKSHLSSFTKSELEEEIVKPWRSLIKHVITPSKEEIEKNPRARSAKLRVASKLFAPHYSVQPF